MESVKRNHSLWISLPVVVLLTVLRNNYGSWPLDVAIGLACALAVWFHDAGKWPSLAGGVSVSIGIGLTVAIGLTKIDGYW